MKHEMPVLTEEQRHALIAALEILKPEVGETQIPALSKAVDIALAALTAETAAWVTMQEEFRDEERMAITNPLEVEWYSLDCYNLTPLFAVPPVPVLKPVVLPGDVEFTTWHPGCGYEPEHAEGVRIGWNLRGDADREAIQKAGYQFESE